MGRVAARKPLFFLILMRGKCSGFTLVEMAVVAGVVIVLLSLTIPAWSGFDRGRRVDSAAMQIRDLLELARAEAVAMNTYTWVALGQDRDENRAESRVWGAAFRSDSGLAEADVDAISPLGRHRRFDSVRLVGADAVHPGLRSQVPPETGFLGGSGRPLPKSLPLAPGFPAAMTVTFTPGGQAMREAEPGTQDGYSAGIAIVVAPTDGASPSPAQNVVELRGSGGMVRIQTVK